MLNPFPGLLDFTFFAPTLLRVVAACVFFYLAYFHYRHRKEVAREISVFSYETAVWMAGIFVLIELITGIGLFIGLYTQIAAILGIIISLKIFFVKRGLKHVSPLSHTAYVLLMVICLSLLITGAGAIAFDVPL